MPEAKPPPGQPGGGSATSPRKTSAAALSVLSNALLLILKFVIGFWTGSIGVLSEAVHSCADLIASCIAFFSVRASDTPPDQDHPYGHGKIESISGLAEALLIFVGAGFIVSEAIGRLRIPTRTPIGTGYGLAVMALSALINTFLSAYLLRIARATDSQALEADARHLRVDVVASTGVFAGLLLVRLTHRAWFDPLTGLVVSLLIVHTAYKLLRDALLPLLDTRLPAAEEAAIRQVLDTDPRVLGYHKLRTRKSGSHRHADVHVQIDDDCTLVEAHDLTEELEDRMRETLPALHINIHIEPYQAEMRHQQEVHGVSTEPAASSGEGEAVQSSREMVTGEDRTIPEPTTPRATPSASEGESESGHADAPGSRMGAR